jgi:thioester reductase-like protein
VEKLTSNLTSRIQVVLTGSTGSLGTMLLKALLSDPNVSKVYCLNRSRNAQERHLKTFTDQGIAELLSSKANFLQASFGDRHLGLTEEKYVSLQLNTDVIIHNAWAVNFNQRLESFESTHLRGVRNFVDFCLASTRRPHFLFVSSVSAVQNWSAINGSDVPVPECVVEDYSVALEMGYGESKHVSERVLGIAAKAGVKASILRVGQIGGPLAMNAGEWNTSEWFPTLLKTSKSIGCIPDTLGAIDWIPVDTLATIIVDIIKDLTQNGIPRTFNLVNPRQASWETLLPVVLARWNVKAVSFAEWLDTLRTVEHTSDLTSLPALKFFDFFENMGADLKNSGNRTMEFATNNSQKASRTMANMTPIDAPAMDIWLDQWNF